MNLRWLFGVFGSIVILALVVVWITKLLLEKPEGKPINQDVAELATLVSEGHALWDQGNPHDAVVYYKTVLRGVTRAMADQSHPVFRKQNLEETGVGLDLELSTIFRRVIDYEADYGDPAEARDWCVHAWHDWNLDLALSSDLANQIWREVQDELGDTGNPFGGES